jgi:hypothetical protein
MTQVDDMRTIVNLPDSLYRESKKPAALRGATVEQLIVEAVDREIHSRTDVASPCGSGDRERLGRSLGAQLATGSHALALTVSFSVA